MELLALYVRVHKVTRRDIKNLELIHTTTTKIGKKSSEILIFFKDQVYFRHNIHVKYK